MVAAPESRIAASALLLLALGCSAHGPTASLLAEREPRRALDPELAVMPVVDSRPELQREGEAPRLIPLLLVYLRVGRYVTGDASFEEPVAPAVTRRVMAALAGAHLGEAEIASAPEGAPDPLAEVCALHPYRYVAESRLETLYAALEQRAIFVFPLSLLYGWDDHTTPPVGRARLHVTVRACGDARVVFEHTATGAYDGRQLSMAPAAARALEIALARLSHELETFPPP
jgi:hypothetical protein